MLAGFLNMVPRKIKWPRSAPLPPPLVPPNLKEMGPVDFSPDDRKNLAAWLSEDGWPRDRMDIVMLEGYLVAMIVWPVELSPGAWLPAIWGIRGWKVAEKIAAPHLYQKFNRLVIGFRQHLAISMNVNPRAFVPGLYGVNGAVSDPNGAMRWCLGFLLALQHGSQGFNWRSAVVTSAVQSIADHSQPQGPQCAKTLEQIAEELGAAVLAIISDAPIARASSPSNPPYHAPLH
ncbi:MAG TPA: YecA family protein [Steroidobacteraceae bacterium]